MSENLMATKADLQEMYSRILPYLGGSADAGFTPVGTVIAVMGVTAPTNYLACNGQVVNIADYPELANYFEQQFGSKNYFGGDGTTTFGICDLRGEFLRGTGTNSHANQGSGAAVGTHQDGTSHREEAFNSDTGWWGIYKATSDNAQYPFSINGYDSIVSSAVGYVSKANTFTAEVAPSSLVTSRPTNTSVLFCIATKNIYLNPSLDYSTDEKVVGTWIDGKTLYQKTVSCGVMPNNSDKSVSHNISNLNKVINISGIVINTASNVWASIPSVVPSDNTKAISYSVNSEAIYFSTKSDRTMFDESYVTIQYTKTTS